jgi:hypothetical protein
LTFSEPLAADTVDETAIVVTAGGEAIDRTVVLSDDRTVVTVTLISRPILPAVATIDIAETITDDDGELFAGARWSFALPVWQQPGGTLDAAPARSVAVAVDSSDRTNVAWAEDDAGTWALRAALWNGVSWELLGDALNVDPTRTLGTPAVAVAAEDRVIVAWFEGTGDFSGGVYAARYQGTAWQLLGGGSLAGTLFGDAAPRVVFDGTDLVIAWMVTH